ncbi:MAG: ammonium transporter [Methanobacteriota archaeon]
MAWMTIDTGDTAWVLLASALVMLMTPGLALFYGGMVRRKNVVGTMVQTFAVLALVSILWVIVGYSLAFGPSKGGIIGGLDWAFLSGVSASEPNPDYAGTIPHQAFMVFQMMFAIITPALLLGAVAERMRFRAMLLFVALWSLLVYAPLAHWVWGVGGWLRGAGSLDFAGGLVVHVSSGVGALAAALYLGRRRGHRRDTMAPNNLPLVLLGAGLLWFGWFGFNAGSAVASGALATSAFVATHVATAAAALGWVVAEMVHRGKPSALGLASGAVAGLVAVTPASGFVTPIGGLLLGLLAGPICYAAVQWKNKAGFDDALDAWGIHGVGGTWGAVATGIFATVAVNAAGKNGLLSSATGALGFHAENASVLVPQLLGVAVAWGFAFVATFVLLFAVDRVVAVRVSSEEEAVGLDHAEHGETGYAVCACPVHSARREGPPAPGGGNPTGVVTMAAVLSDAPRTKK